MTGSCPSVESALASVPIVDESRDVDVKSVEAEVRGWSAGLAVAMGGCADDGGSGPMRFWRGALNLRASG